MLSTKTPSPAHRRVVVALSGGVDSAVAAYLLKKRGYLVSAMFMENWRKTKNTPRCTTEEDRRDALRVALHLDIPFSTVSFEREYKEQVTRYFYREYAAGRTPNPDIMCNTKIKFHAFLRHALSQGADMIATGHYARICFTHKTFTMQTGVDPKKDQSYFLHTLQQAQLEKILFPLGGLKKSEVRTIAKRAQLPNARKPDSQGICFLGPINIVQYLRTQIPEKPGPITTATGKKVGTHRGLAFYTIGQREGMGIGGGVPYYVAKKIIKSNTIVVAHGNSDPILSAWALYASHPTWIAGTQTLPLSCNAVIRYHQVPQKATVMRDVRGLRVAFVHPQRAITPGQSVVFYKGETCLGGAIIESSEET